MEWELDFILVTSSSTQCVCKPLFTRNDCAERIKKEKWGCSQSDPGQKVAEAEKNFMFRLAVGFVRRLPLAVLL